MDKNIQCMYSEESQNFILLEELVTPEITIPIGFRSDGFSSPRSLRWFVNRVEKGWYAAWVHDYCYVNAINDKEYADKLFYKNLLKSGVKKYKAKIMYYAVKIGGKGNY